MRILITNDDGIYSEGLSALVQAALEHGHDVLVSAPSSQQSAASQRITLSQPLIVHKKTFLGENVEAYAVDGTPADCVRIAPQLTEKSINLCISGINNGENAGSAVYYSGTVSAAREAAMHYFPAFAVSIMEGANHEMLMHLANLTMDLIDKCSFDRFPRMCVVNINAPALPPDELKSLELCALSDAYYTDYYEKRINPFGKTYFWLNSGLTMEEPPEGSDYYYLRLGHPTVTVLGCYNNLNPSADQFLHIFP